MSGEKKKKQEKKPVVLEETIPEVVEIDMEALRNEVSGIVKERDEYLAMLQRTAADFENYKKRNAQLRLDVEAQSKRDTISSILPVLDNLLRALEVSPNIDNDKLSAGVDMVVKQFLKVMGELGIEEIDSSTGVTFDPMIHNAIQTVPTDDQHADNTVFDTLQKGYRLGDKIIRYAMVRVAKD